MLQLRCLYFILMGLCHDDHLKALARDEREVTVAFLLPPLPHDDGVPGNGTFLKARIEVKSQIIPWVSVGPTLQVDGKSNKKMESVKQQFKKSKQRNTRSKEIIPLGCDTDRTLNPNDSSMHEAARDGRKKRHRLHYEKLRSNYHHICFTSQST